MNETQPSKKNKKKTLKTHKSNRTVSQTNYRPGAIVISLAAMAVSYNPAIMAAPITKSKAAAKKTLINKTKEEKPTGVWGWTSGEQTYIRSRPGALTAPVAKVGKHTKLFVWGKFDGWYRVETPDHIFGWVYHSYINSPDTPKIKLLSHAKARSASDRTSHQTMYGSKEVLRRQYVRYGAPGAAKGLAKQGVRVAELPAPTKVDKAAPTRTAKVAPNAAPKAAPKIIAKAAPKATNKAVKLAQQPITAKTGVNLRTARVSTGTVLKSKPTASRYARRDLPQMPRVEMTEVGTARFNPALPPNLSLPGGRSGHKQPTSNLPVVTTPSNTGTLTAALPAPTVTAPAQGLITPDAVAITPSIKSSASRTIAPVAAPEQVKPAKSQATTPVVQVTKPKVNKAASKTIQKVVKPKLVKPATAPVVVAKAKAPAKPRSYWAARRIAAAQRRQRIKEQRREQLRMKMGSPATMMPPTTAPGLAPLSPEELLRARDAHLASQSRPPLNGSVESTPSSNTKSLPIFGPATISPSSFNDGTIKSNATDEISKAKDKTTATPAASIVKTTNPQRQASNVQNLRGGSPRDRYKSLNNSRFGSAMVGEALTYRGMPYISGAESPRRGFDCSGFVYFLLRRRGYNPPRTASGYGSYGTRVARGQLQAGDILLFANTYKRGISHVGIYMGNDKFVHAANGGRGVTTDSLSSGYYAKHYYGARRVK